MNDAFENAFYQLDQDRDGVVTLRDLGRYVLEHNLKDKFIQKWLTLFGDEKNIIYYDKFCETLGIIPLPEKFEQKTFRMDMREKTREVVVNLINEFHEKDTEYSDVTLQAINEKLCEVLGDTWKITIDPTKSELDTKYAQDGLLYYSPNLSKSLRILVYREAPEIVNKPSEAEYDRNTSFKTEESVQSNFSPYQSLGVPVETPNLEEENNLVEKTPFKTEESVQSNFSPYQSLGGPVETPNLEEEDKQVEETLFAKGTNTLNTTPDKGNVESDDDRSINYSMNEIGAPNSLGTRKSKTNDGPSEAENDRNTSSKTEESIQSNFSLYQSLDGPVETPDLEEEDNLVEETIFANGTNPLNTTPDEQNDESDDHRSMYYSINEIGAPNSLGTRKSKTNDGFTGVVYKKDISEETEESIEDIIHQILLNNDGHISRNNLDDIIHSIEERHDDKWGIILNPTPNELDIEYEEDGIIYCSLDETEDPKMVIWREPNKIEGFTGIVYKKDMSKETEESIEDIIYQKSLNDGHISRNNLDDIIHSIEERHGDKWGIILNPTKNQLSIQYEEDGLLYFSLDETENTKMVIWREPKKIEGKTKEIIYESVMSTSVKEGVFESVNQNYDSRCDKSPKTEKIIKDLNEKYGPSWNMIVNPSQKELIVDYDFDGKIYYSPNSEENVKLLVWRQDKDKNRGKMCFCCF